ncbi:unnamed protein product, partial [Schistosoma margrebowiei]
NLTNCIHNINPNKTFKLIHGNSKVSPQSIALSKTSFEDNSASDICTDDENIQLRQKLLDKELEMIDKRINRLRLSSACDLHENQSHSAKLSRKDLEESTQINDNITPRNMYIVEGCVCGDNGVSDRKDSSNLPIDLLNTKPNTGEKPSLSLISQPTTTVALDVSMLIYQFSCLLFLFINLCSDCSEKYVILRCVEMTTCFHFPKGILSCRFVISPSFI